MTSTTETAVLAYLSLGIVLAFINAVMLYLMYRYGQRLGQWLTAQRSTEGVERSVPAELFEPLPPPPTLALFTVWDSAWYWTKMDAVKFKLHHRTPSPRLESELLRGVRELEEIADAHPQHPDAVVFLRRAAKCRQALQALQVLSQGRILDPAR